METTTTTTEIPEAVPLHPDLAGRVVQMSMGPMIKHPLINLFYGGPTWHAQYNEWYARKQELARKFLDEKRWMSYLFFIERPYRVDAFLEIADRMTNREYWETVQEVWIDSENIFENWDEWKTIFESTRPGRRRWMMSAQEKKVLASLPDPVRVYRGCIQEVNEDGFSWTTDPDVAVKLAKRDKWRGDPVVIVADVEKKDIAAYFTGRNEFEVVLNDPYDYTVDHYLTITDEEEK